MRSTSGASAIYGNRDLDSSLEEIRLLDIHPGAASSPVTCTLRVASLQVTPIPYYEALSYTWGDASVKREIVLNGYLVEVTLNLHSALKQLRGKDDIRVVWADAVCINQTDVDERTKQVGMMGRIYSACENVAIWLCDPPASTVPTVPVHWTGGEEDDILLGRYWDDFKTSSGVTLSSCDWLFHAMASLRLTKNGHLSAVPVFNEMVKPGFRYPVSFFEYQWEVTQALWTFTGSPWGTRMWTVQESILPRRGIVILGHVSIDLEFLLDIVDELPQHILSACCTSIVSKAAPFLIAALEDLDQGSSKIHDLRMARDVGEETDMWDILTTFFHRDATDDRDKIFGILGLVDPSGEHEVVPDYRASVEDVYCETALVICRRTSSLLPLHYPLTKNLHPDLPSWVIDWTVPGKTITNRKDGLRWTEPLFRTFLPSKDPCYIQPHADNRVLEVRGRFCDRVVSVGRVCPHDTPGRRETYGEWFRLAGLDRDPGRAYGGLGDTALNAFWRSLCWDQRFSESTEQVGDGVIDTGRYHDRGVSGGYEAFVEFCQSSPASPFHPNELSDRDKEAVVALEPRLRDAGRGSSGRPTERANLLGMAIRLGTTHHVFFTTESGYFGVGPEGIVEKDEVWTLFGAWMPFVLRPGESRKVVDGGDDEKRLRTVLGCSYVHGIMDGEVVDNADIAVEAAFLY